MVDSTSVSREMARQIVDSLVDGKAEDTVLLDITEQSVLAEFFIITTGGTDRQVRALAERVTEKLGEAGVQPLRVEGLSDARWVVLDFNGVMLHIFTPFERRFYNLEELWSEATTVARVL
ncbi:MAG TPA: ribosome silencing factor [Chloroflexota bacterium]|jgi:ribosome-associated protein